MTCSEEPECNEKHVESDDTWYVDLAPQLGTNETVSSVVSVTCEDVNLTAGSATVLTAGYTDTITRRDKDGNTTTITYVIAANKGVSFTLSGGTPGAGCSIITVKYLKSTGKYDAAEVKVKVIGEDV